MHQGLDAKVTFIGKHTAFKYGLGVFLRYMGGIPVDRNKPGGIIKDAINQIKDINSSLIGISPEGTRSKVKEWKTGFLRIAILKNPVFHSFTFERVPSGDIPIKELLMSLI